jgi:hypothetical protein
MASPSLHCIALLSASLATGCYTRPSESTDTDDAASTGTAAATEGDDGDGSSNPVPTSSTPDGSGGEGSSGEPSASTGAMADGTDTGPGESTGAVVGTGSTGGGLESTTGDDGSSSEDATTGPDVPKGQCNEMLGVACGRSQFCDYPDDMCGAGEHGVCAPEPMLCNLILQPSCGCNGSNYSNPCVATANGTDFAHFGDC